MNTVSKRITYSYFDYKEGTLQSYIDVDLKIDDTNEVVELSPAQLQSRVERKWRLIGYREGELNSVEQLYID